MNRAHAAVAKNIKSAAENNEKGEKMSKQEQCPVCYNYIEFEDGAAYCFMCDEVYTETEDGLESDLLDWINKQP